MGYAFTGLDSAQRQLLTTRYGDPPATGAGEVEIQLFRAPRDAFLPLASDRRTYAFDLEHSRCRLCLAGFRFAAIVDLTSTRLVASLWIADPGHGFLSIVANLLRTLVAYCSLARGGVLLHSAGVVWAGKARLFVGQSGAGKSSLARLALHRGLEVLSDDLNAIHSHDGRPHVTGLPFTGDLGTAGCTARGTYPLAGLYCLQRKDSDALEPISLATAFASVLGCSPFLNHDPHRVGDLMKLLDRLLDNVPRAGLSFRLDGRVWDLLDAEPSS
ncbi:MAG: hypothetical protein AAF657_15980 [Acidobacteriota bacterium]